MSWTVPSWKTPATFAAVVALALALPEGRARAAAPPVERGGVTKRSTMEGSFTAEDRVHIREIGLPSPHAAVTILRKLGKSEGGRQQARLRALARAPEGFAPSGACDELVADGEAHGLCRGHVSGPLGDVAVRMPIAAKLTEGANGALQLVLNNPRALEAKGLFSWSTVVAPGHMVLVYELLPDPDGWLVSVRFGVEMSAHEGSAKTIAESMLKLESWLTRELGKP